VIEQEEKDLKILKMSQKINYDKDPMKTPQKELVERMQVIFIKKETHDKTEFPTFFNSFDFYICSLFPPTVLCIYLFVLLFIFCMLFCM
jgi:hypothetical protein